MEPDKIQFLQLSINSIFRNRIIINNYASKFSNYSSKCTLMDRRMNYISAMKNRPQKLPYYFDNSFQISIKESKYYRDHLCKYFPYFFYLTLFLQDFIMRINKRQMIEHSRIKVKNGKTLSRRIRAQLDKEWSKLGFEDWHRLNLSKQFAEIDEYHVMFLNLNNNNYPSILKDIQNVSFPFLMKLHLHDNFIETIEGISRISIPSLQQFNIDSNRLIRITELRKGYFPQLQFLSLFNNLNASMELTSLTQTSAPLNEILLEVPQTQPHLGLAWISKLSSPKISCVLALSNKRIKKTKIYQVLKMKYSSLSVETHP